MEKQRRINTLVICGLIAVVTVMSIGFATLSQQLLISGTTTVKSSSSSWNVYFSQVTPTIAGNANFTTSPAISTDSTLSGSNNKITFACELTAPGDSCTVTAEITNGGTLNALYKGYTFSVGGTTQTGTSVTLDSGAIVTVTPATGWTADTTTLASKDTGTFVIKMELPSTVTSLPSTDEETTVELTIDFEQATS